MRAFSGRSAGEVWHTATIKCMFLIYFHLLPTWIALRDFCLGARAHSATYGFSFQIFIHLTKQAMLGPLCGDVMFVCDSHVIVVSLWECFIILSSSIRQRFDVCAVWYSRIFLVCSVVQGSRSVMAHFHVPLAEARDNLESGAGSACQYPSAFTWELRSALSSSQHVGGWLEATSTKPL